MSQSKHPLKLIGKLITGAQEGAPLCANDVWKLIDMDTGEDLMEKLHVTGIKLELSFDKFAVLTLTTELSEVDVEGLGVLNVVSVEESEVEVGS